MSGTRYLTYTSLFSVTKSSPVMASVSSKAAKALADGAHGDSPSVHSTHQLLGIQLSKVFATV